MNPSTTKKPQTVTKYCPELLLACLVVVLSIWFWRRRYQTQVTNPQDFKDANRTVTHMRDQHQPPHDPHLSSSSVQSPVLFVSANNSSKVNAPTLSGNTFHGPQVFNFNTTSEKEPKGGEDHATTHSDESVLQNILESHKESMRRKTKCIFEGKKDAKYKTELRKVFTQLFITEGELNEVNNEHEILKITKDNAFRVQESQQTPIDCNEIFRPKWKTDGIKTVLTKGIAGIGKTVSVQKFILDWAEGVANRDIDCMFLLPFREINLIEDTEYSLHELLLEFHPELEEVKETKLYKNLKLAFIFDGLDESRLLLEFNSRMVGSVEKRASVGSIITNLIKGNLLPSALIWITSRPAAANQIPSEYVSMFTEVRGFTDKQKEEYIRKRIPDQTVATKIIDHVRVSRSLYIMCHIPVFCWITTTVLQKILDQGDNTPSTLTEMYVHFLLIQMNMKNQKYDQNVQRDMTRLFESNQGLILKLAKLAFEQLKKENIMFYENDLRECGIDITADSEHTGMCAEIFKKESVLHEKKVYCFIHLSLQEFLAALHVFYTYLNKNMDDLKFFFTFEIPDNVPFHVLLKKAVDKAKESERGHLDLFLRFLMGISHESNQELLKGLLPCIENTKKSISNVIQYIKQIQNKDTSPKKSINHFFCLLELKDSSLYKQIRKYLDAEEFPERYLSVSNCSALAYILLMSEEVLDELDPKKYNTSNAACRNLVPAVRCCRKAMFAGCELTEHCCESIAAALQSENSLLRELDLSDNYQLEKAVKLLSSGLKSSQCKLEILRLARCHFNINDCAELVSALSSVAPCLKELDLSNNDLHDSGLNLLLGLKNSCSKLQILRLSWCYLTKKSCESLSSFLNTSSGSCLRELDLRDNDLENAGVKCLSSSLEDPKCQLEILRLSGCMITVEGFSSLASALQSNLRELDLNYNHPGDFEENLLSAVLKDPHCTVLPEYGTKMETKGEHFIKPGIKKYACRLTLDPDTAHNNLCLSDDNRKVTNTGQSQGHPDHPERFQLHDQVLCKESLSGRCYWEVDFEDSTPHIGVTYSDIQRVDDDLSIWAALGKLGMNPVSWSLGCNIRYSTHHNSQDTYLPASVPKSGRIGVFLDWPAGILTFYSVCSGTGTLLHLHTFKTTFRKPLYAAFFLHRGSLTVCKMD